MTANDIRALKNEEIQSKITELKEELFNLRFQAAVGNLEDTAQIKKVKKDIARMKTVISERSE